MLAASPLRNTKDEMEGFGMGGDDFGGFSDGSLLESIDFDDLFISINDGDVLPDLEMDSEILAEFSVTSGEEESEINTSERVDIDNSRKLEEVDKVWESTLNPNEEIVSKTDSTTTNPPRKQIDKDKRSSAQSKNPQPKRKVKVDWTPELHRRFVQAVEQLGVDKAVPSRILEIMGIDCLTRHNIASHLQKYRSHRKHLLAREAEAASWSQRRQMYGGTATGAGGSKRNISPWLAPTMGFPPMTPMHHFRPLHVWGHPSVDPSPMHVWPKHLLPSSPCPSPPAWPPTPHPPPPPRPTPEPPFWHSHYQRVAACPMPGTPCFPPPLAPTRFTAPPVVPGVPPHAMYKLDPGVGVPTGKPGPHHPPLDFYPSKESVDAAIEDVISKPWLPLPLGLKPPSMDSVLDELQRQGIPSIPPTTCA